MTKVSTIGDPGSSIDLAQYDVERADQRDNVRHQMPLAQSSQPLQVAERRRAYAKAVRVGRFAIADDEISELALRRLDRVVGFAGRRLDQAGDLPDNRAFRQPFGRLTDDPQRLAELLHPYEIAIVGIARCAKRNIEVHL